MVKVKCSSCKKLELLPTGIFYCLELKQSFTDIDEEYVCDLFEPKEA